MRHFIPLTFLLAILFLSCKQKPASFSRQYLNESKLTLQTFTINPARDTTLTSLAGVRIHISEGTFTGKEPVLIEFRDALDFESILQAGLLTQAGDKMLSSAGMFYFNTRGNLAIREPIGIDVPAATALQGMKLFKGDSSGGGMNWKDPEPIVIVPAPIKGVGGKALFQSHCASCHRVDKDLTGPALAGVTAKWKALFPETPAPAPTADSASEEDDQDHGDHVAPDTSDGEYGHNPLYDYTINNQKYLAYRDYNCYACMLFKKWNKTAMNIFPGLSYADMDALYKYIEDETERLGLSKNQYDPAADSFNVKAAEIAFLQKERSRLTEENGPSVKVERSMPPVAFDPGDTISNWPLPAYKQQVVPISKNADYYQVTIRTNGWYNLDIKVENRNNVSESKLMIQLQGNDSKEFQVFLAIPSFKVLAEGGYLESSSNIGFADVDGTLPLPQKTAALVFAMGEEKGQFYFAKQWFNTTADQLIKLEVKAMNQQDFEREIRQIQQPDMEFAIDTSKNIRSLKKIDARLEALGAGYLKNCDCAEFPSPIFYEPLKRR